MLVGVTHSVNAQCLVLCISEVVPAVGHGQQFFIDAVGGSVLEIAPGHLQLPLPVGGEGAVVLLTFCSELVKLGNVGSLRQWHRGVVVSRGKTCAVKRLFGLENKGCSGGWSL